MKWIAAMHLPTGIDAVATAGLFGAVAGAASVVEPYWTGLSEALATVAAVGWVARARTEAGVRRRTWVPPAIAGVAVAFALVAPSPWNVGRGLGFGGAAAVLAWGARRGVRFGEDGA
ncbi:MAG: hypothetical protein L3K05_04565 [Thermoplasmata archaeon]|nr:hypothetical protein [Thermoplasmata archaeon]